MAITTQDLGDVIRTVETRPSGDGTGQVRTETLTWKAGTNGANKQQIEDRLRAYRDQNRTFKDLANASITDNQLRAQVKDMARQINILIRLYFNETDDVSDT
jgi:hypothetical protein